MKYKVKKEHSFDVSFNDDFVIGKREENSKRNFLFISKIIGKHLESDPCRIIFTGHSLAELVKDCKNDTKTLMVGFAETATGIAMSAAWWLNLSYISTTREEFPVERLEFLEEHSHAAKHYCYGLKEHADEFDEIIFVDDEITTGNSVLNMIWQMKKFMKVNKFRVVSILDWRTKEDRNKADQFAKDNKIQISFHSLIDGEIIEKTDDVYKKQKCKNITTSFVSDDYLTTKERLPSKFMTNVYSGRFLMTSYDLNRAYWKTYLIAKELNKSLPTEVQDILLLGHGENIFFPMLIACFLTGKRKKITIKSTTRSPICVDHENIHSKIHFLDRNKQEYYIYNIEEMESHDIVLFISEAANEKNIEIPKLTYNMAVCFTGSDANDFMKKSEDHFVESSYLKEDCIFLLQDLSDKIKNISIEEKENYINQGGNYSEVISKEDDIEPDIYHIFQKLTKQHAYEIAGYIGGICDHLYKKYQENMIFVSLARAGSPVGVLMKRYMEWKYEVKIPHYSISIIRDKGIDETALDYITKRYPKNHLCFIDGWTGRGSITMELRKAIKKYNEDRNTNLSDELIVLMDPAKLSHISGTQKDICLPNACLNSTVSGLISRTICPKDLKQGEFHGAKYLKEFQEEDMSEWFLFQIVSKFHMENPEIETKTDDSYVQNVYQALEKDFAPIDHKKVKLSIGEVSRGLIRRVPKVLLVKDKKNPDLEFVLYMAKKKNVEVREYDTKDYECIAILE